MCRGTVHALSSYVQWYCWQGLPYLCGTSSPPTFAARSECACTCRLPTLQICILGPGAAGTNCTHQITTDGIITPWPTIATSPLGAAAAAAPADDAGAAGADAAGSDPDIDVPPADGPATPAAPLAAASDGDGASA